MLHILQHYNFKNNSINNTNDGRSDGAIGGCIDSTLSSNRSDSGDAQNKNLKIDFNNKSSNVNSNTDVTAKEMNKGKLKVIIIHVIVMAEWVKA